MPYISKVQKSCRQRMAVPLAGLNGSASLHGKESIANNLHLPSPTSAEISDSLRFMFAVGIECSNPIVAGNHRVDQLESTGHYEHWKKDLHLVRDLGLRYLRYGPPIHRIFTGPGQYRWDLLDPVMEEMARLGIRPIIDFVHFGLPDWLRDFQNPEWPKHVAEYAAAFCQRYPWVRFFTPVNEIFVTGAVFRRVRLVERAAHERSGVCDEHQAFGKGINAGDA